MSETKSSITKSDISNKSNWSINELCGLIPKPRAVYSNEGLIRRVTRRPGQFRISSEAMALHNA